MHIQRMDRLLANGVATIVFLATLAAATKASVHGHWVHYLHGLVLTGVALLLALAWLNANRYLRPDWLGMSRSVFLRAWLATMLVVPALFVTDRLIDSSLVSNRSYGTVAWNALVLLALYGLWRRIARRGPDDAA
ncbi:MAG: hypothetical protein PHQ14_13520 [Chromatiales bacterium]|jgi:hypothetical protein|nr:hypothetical protein [Chromatiales bacterium]